MIKRNQAGKDESLPAYSGMPGTYVKNMISVEEKLRKKRVRFPTDIDHFDADFDYVPSSIDLKPLEELTSVIETLSCPKQYW